MRVVSACTGSGDCGSLEDEFRKTCLMDENKNWSLFQVSEIFEAEVIFEDSCFPWSLLLNPSLWE